MHARTKRARCDADAPQAQSATALPTPPDPFRTPCGKTADTRPSAWPLQPGAAPTLRRPRRPRGRPRHPARSCPARRRAQRGAPRPGTAPSPRSRTAAPAVQAARGRRGGGRVVLTDPRRSRKPPPQHRNHISEASARPAALGAHRTRTRHLRDLDGVAGPPAPQFPGPQGDGRASTPPARAPECGSDPTVPGPPPPPALGGPWAGSEAEGRATPHSREPPSRADFRAAASGEREDTGESQEAAERRRGPDGAPGRLDPPCPARPGLLGPDPRPDSSGPASLGRTSPPPRKARALAIRKRLRAPQPPDRRGPRLDPAPSPRRRLLGARRWLRSHKMAALTAATSAPAAAGHAGKGAGTPGGPPPWC
ncbi:basic proline-rich protein-like [Oryctolagus cuniculus]|uniref:basic proline-rich protein-like n=1 Tax=Oryctolagus cuniculus TaxID=9986 RepID=UPI003879A538